MLSPQNQETFSTIFIISPFALMIGLWVWWMFREYKSEKEFTRYKKEQSEYSRGFSSNPKEWLVKSGWNIPKPDKKK